MLGHKEATVSLGLAARGGLMLPACMWPNRACSQVKLGGGRQSEPNTAGHSRVPAVVGAC